MECKFCEREAVFTIRQLSTGEWIETCAQHDNYIGRENLRSMGLTPREAMIMNKQIKDVLDTERLP